MKKICNLQSSRAGLDSYSIWKLIPDCICEHTKFWQLVPTERKISIIINSFNDKLNNKKKWWGDEIPDQLIKIFNSCSEIDKRIYLTKIPDELKYHPKIFKICSPLEQIRLLGNGCEQHPQRNEGFLDEIAEIIQSHKISSGKIPKSILAYPSIREIYFHYPNVESKSDHPEAEKIQAFVKEREIKYLVHLTTVKNFKEICRSTAILSRQKIQILGIVSTPFDEERLNRKLEHICCSITNYNFYMFYKLVYKLCESCVLMYIKPDYLWKQGTLFCSINAASGNGAYIREGLATLQSMFADEVRDNNGLQTRIGKPNNLPTCIQAEVLVYESISLEDVLTVYVPYDSTQQELLDLGYEEDKIQVINPSDKRFYIFNPFKYHSEWIVKEQPQQISNF